MKNSFVKGLVMDISRFFTVGFSLVLAVTGVVFGQGVPIPNGDPDPQLLVGELLGNIAVDNTGAASYSIPIDVSPGTAGMEPKLAISYNSQRGNGLLGVGFSVDGLSGIVRTPCTILHDGFIDGVDFDSNDRFMLDGQRLIKISGTYGLSGSQYRTEIDNFSRVTLYGNVNDSSSYFKVETKAGLIMEYGHSSGAMKPDGRTENISWLVDKVSDTAGNYMQYIYVSDYDGVAGEHLLDRIEYTMNDAMSLTTFSSVEFVYEPRPDTLSGFRAGSEFNRTKRLERVRVMYGADEVFNYQLEYIQNNSNVSLLKSVQKFMGINSIPKTVFDWNSEGAVEGWGANESAYAPPYPLAKTGHKEISGDDPLLHIRGCNLVTDANGDGYPDIFYSEYYNSGGLVPDVDVTYLNTGAGYNSSIPNDTTSGFHLDLYNNYFFNEFMVHDESDIYDDGYRFADLNGDGLVDILSAWQLFLKVSPYASYTRQAAWMSAGTGWDGSSAANYIPGGYFSTHNSSKTYATLSSDFRHIDSGYRYVDLDGDGLSDLIRSFTEYNASYGATVLSSWALMNNGNELDSSPNSAYQPPHPFVYTSGDGFNYGTRLMDINADGLIDMVLAGPSGSGVRLNAGTGWETSDSSAYALPYNLVDSDGYDIGTRFVDVNGDGLIDIVNKQNAFYLNTGNGWIIDSAGTYTLPVPVISGNQKHLIQFVDLNGDGLDDLVSNYSGQTIYLNNGHGWMLQGATTPNYKLPYQFARQHDGQTVPLGQCFNDLNGDGLVDYFYNHSWYQIYANTSPSYKGNVKGAVLNQGTFGNLLIRVTKGWRSETVHGLVTEIDYKPITDSDVYIKGSSQSFPWRDVQGALYVVSEQRRDNGISGMNRTIYAYSEAISHRDRGFLGFKTFESYDDARQLSKIDTLKQKYPHTGSPELSQTYYIPNPNDFSTKQLIKQVQNTYLYDNVTGGTVFPYVGKSVEIQWDYTTAGIRKQISNTTTYNWFDNQPQGTFPPSSQPSALPGQITHGNITKIQVEYGDGSSEVSINNYTSNTSGGNWYLGRLQNASVTHDLNVAGKNPITKSSSFIYDPNTGLLKKEISEPGDPVLEMTTEYMYDGYGNVTDKKMTGPTIPVYPRPVQHTVFDSKGRFVDETYNVLNHKETIEEYDQQLGLVKRQRGPNGLPTSWEHDDLGRTVLETRADNTSTSTSFEWTDVDAYESLIFTDPDNAAQTLQVDSPYKITTSASGAPTATVWFDRKGRGVRSQTTGPDGRVIIKDTIYNILGQTVAVSEPYFQGDLIYYTRTIYGPLERPSSVTLPDGTINQYVYDGLVGKVIIDSNLRITGPTAKHQIMTTEKNERGQVVRVTDALSKTLAYEYHADGNLHKTIAQGNITTTMTYDLRDNKVGQVDPDMGTWSYVYNALGQLVSQTDAKSQTTTMLYDFLGRMYQRTATDEVAKWYYDNPGEGGKLGALHREELFDGTGVNLIYRKTYAYDSLKRPLFDLMNYDSKWYYNYARYDEFSRVKEAHRFWRPQSVIQSGDQLDHHWNSFGTINTFDSIGTVLEVRDTKDHIWWSRETDGYDARGNLTQFTQGNGITTVSVHDLLTGRLSSVKSFHGTDDTNIALYNTYGFDRIGNLDSRHNASLLLTETFTYDEVNRLRETRLGGSLESEVTYDNSQLGNRIASKTGIGTYTYGQNGAGPHAVTSAGGISYGYDANGNLDIRTQGGNDTTDISWATFNKPLRIDTDAANLLGSEKYSEFTYDINHSRITQIIRKGSSLKKKIYIGGMEQEEVSSDLQTPVWVNTETRIFISTPSGVIGVHVQDATEQITRKYFHNDHLGSIIAVSVDQVGAADAEIEEQYSYDPWGNRRDHSNWTPFADLETATANLETDRGFTGHEMLDNVELVHMNGRIYDPVIGVFLSADSFIQSPYNLQSHNRYSYVVNNPLTLTDPSGHFFGVIFAWLGAAAGFVGGAIVSAGIYAAANPVIVGTILGGISGGMSGGIGGAIKGAFMGGVVAGLFAGPQVSVLGSPLLSTGTEILAHGVVQGGLAGFNGGEFGPAFLAGFSGAALGTFGNFLTGDNTAGGLIAAAVVGGTASKIGGGKFSNGAISGTFAFMLSSGVDMKKLGRDALSLGKLWGKDIMLGIRGIIWDNPKALKLGLGEVWSTHDSLMVRFALVPATVAQHIFVPVLGDWLGAHHGAFDLNLSDDEKNKAIKNKGIKYQNDDYTKMDNGSIAHDFGGNDAWRHAKWVKDVWIGRGVQPGLFGQVYRAAGTVVFPVISLGEYAVGSAF